MKKVFASAVAAALALTMAVPAFAAETAKITADSETKYAKAGDSIVVNFNVTGVEELLALDNIKGNGNIGAGNFIITYDPSKVVMHEDSGFLEGLQAPFGQSVTDLPEQGKVSVQFFDASSKGRGKDIKLGSLTFQVAEGVKDGDVIEIGVAADGDSSVLVATGATLDDPTFPIPVEETGFGEAVKVTVGDEPSTSEDQPSTSEDQPSTSEDQPSDTTDNGGNATTDNDGNVTTDNGGNATTGNTTTGNGGTTAKPGNNNKTGDAGVLAIGGLMVLAAGATMLTLKKKSK